MQTWYETSRYSTNIKAVLVARGIPKDSSFEKHYETFDEAKGALIKECQMEIKTADNSAADWKKRLEEVRKLAAPPVVDGRQ